MTSFSPTGEYLQILLDTFKISILINVSFLGQNRGGTPVSFINYYKKFDLNHNSFDS